MIIKFICVLILIAGLAVGASFNENLRQLYPSSRRSALIISEIMYHPLTNNVGPSLEYLEIFNSEPIDIDLSSYKLAGDIDFEFPESYILPGRSFVVIAANPAAIESKYSLNGILGPWQGQLSNKSGEVKLITKHGAILIDLSYKDSFPWPVSPDGGGNSLVMTFPDYGHNSHRAWSASQSRGGTPLNIEHQASNTNIVFNETYFDYNNTTGSFIELFNLSANSLDISDWFMSDHPTNLKYQIPLNTQIESGGFCSLSPTNMLLNPDGGVLYLFDSNGENIVATLKYKAQIPGKSLGCFPNGSHSRKCLAAPTPNAANLNEYLSDIIINEIMYNPISGDVDDEYIEIYNRGENAVDVSGWEFFKGIEFVFPQNTVISSNEFLVIAKNKTHLIDKYSHLNDSNTLGDYNGKLSNSGELISLGYPVNPNNQDSLFIVDELFYQDSESWGKWSDAGGSSLELKNIWSDNDSPDNWAGSIEYPKSTWTEFEHTGRLDNGTGNCDELQVIMLDSGECLIDDLEVIKKDESINRISNPSFDNGLTDWLIEGTHIDSTWDNTQQALHVVASKGGDNGANRIETDLSANLSNGDYASIRTRAKWVGGSQLLLLRLKGNYLELPCILKVPSELGSPGLANSTLLSASGPPINDVQHYPVLPAANENVIITAAVKDLDQVKEVNCYYRLDTQSTFVKISMKDDGVQPDKIAMDGLYSGQIPGQSSGKMLVFYITTIDENNSVNTFPQDISQESCLIRFGETTHTGLFGTYKIWISDSNVKLWSQRNKFSNHPINCTFVYSGFRAIYNCGSRYHGSPWVRIAGSPVTTDASFNLYTPDDEILGSSSFFLDKLERDTTYLRERMSFWIANQLGAPFINMRYIHLDVNGQSKGVIYSDSQHFNQDFLDSWFPNNSDGDLFEIKDWFEFKNWEDGEDIYFSSQVNGTIELFNTENSEPKVARYRWNWDKKPSNAADDDYNPITSVVQAINNNDEDRITQAIDIDANMKSFAVRHVISDWDGYGCDRGKNAYSFTPYGGKWQVIQWDLDMALGAGSVTDYSLFTIQDPALKNKLFKHPAFLRKYWYFINQAVNGPLSAANFNHISDNIYQGLNQNDVDVSSPSVVDNWVSERRAYITTQLASVDSIFEITSNNGEDFSTPLTLCNLQGTSPISVSYFLINGTKYPITWTSVNTWEVEIGLFAGDNIFKILGFDLDDTLVPNCEDEISIFCSGSPDFSDLKVVINEIMYAPNDTQEEFVEIYNPSQSYYLSLSNFYFQGIDYTFSANAFLPPNGFIVLTKNIDNFKNVYGSLDVPIFEYGGGLSDFGEALSLFKADGTLQDQVQWSNEFPWSTTATQGYSLQLLNPLADNTRPASWGCDEIVKYTPGTPNSLFYLTENLPNLWLNEFQYNHDASPAWLELVVQSELSSSNDLIALVESGHIWKFYDRGINLSTSWKETNYDDNSWSSGPSKLGYGDSDIQTVIDFGDDSNNKYPTTYFRSYFDFNDDIAKLILRVMRDDGIIVYLNGQEVFRDNMDSGTIVYDDYASGLASGDDERTWYEVEIDASLLVKGDNTLAVEVHQINAGSSDLGMDLELIAIKPNNGYSLNGFYLSDSTNDLLKWAFPADAKLSIGAFPIVWLDNLPELSTSTDFHANFTPNPMGGNFILSKKIDDEILFIDSFPYYLTAPDVSMGSFPDGNYPHNIFSNVTPQAPNVNSDDNPSQIFINEWLASSDLSISPLTGESEDWFELYNANPFEVDLSGWILADSSTVFTLPNNTIIPANEFFLIWADDQAFFDTISNDFHVPFKLSKTLESLYLKNPVGILVDGVAFSNQILDVSEGRWEDGSTNIIKLDIITPGMSNLLPEPSFFGIISLAVLFYMKRKL